MEQNWAIKLLKCKVKFKNVLSKKFTFICKNYAYFSVQYKIDKKIFMK